MYHRRYFTQRETTFCVLRNNTGSFWDVPHISRHHAKTLYLKWSNYALKYKIKIISKQHFNVNFGWKFTIGIFLFEDNLYSVLILLNDKKLSSRFSNSFCYSKSHLFHFSVFSKRSLHTGNRHGKSESKAEWNLREKIFLLTYLSWSHILIFAWFKINDDIIFLSCSLSCLFKRASNLNQKHIVKLTEIYINNGKWFEYHNKQDK